MLHAVIFGHSICRRLLEHIDSGVDVRLRRDFKLESQVSVDIIGKGGLRLKQLVVKDGVGHTILRKAMRSKPHIVFIQIGGNDFNPSAPIDAEEFALQMLALAGFLHGHYKVKQVLVGGLLPRFTPSADCKCNYGLSLSQVQSYSEWGQSVNARLKEHSKSLNYVKIWNHDKFLFRDSKRSLFARDGVHLSAQGHFLFYKSVRGALITASR